MSTKALITQGTIQAAFIAISSRIVGSTFRFMETLNPEFQKARVISDPPTVLVRELVTISMAWGFALLTNIAIKPLAQRKGWGNFGVQMVTAIIGTTIAESIGRFVAYRKALQEDKKQAAQGVKEERQKVFTKPILQEAEAPLKSPMSPGLTNNGPYQAAPLYPGFSPYHSPAPVPPAASWNYTPARAWPTYGWYY